MGRRETKWDLSVRFVYVAGNEQSKKGAVLVCVVTVVAWVLICVVNVRTWVVGTGVLGGTTSWCEEVRGDTEPEEGV